MAERITVQTEMNRLSKEGFNGDPEKMKRYDSLFKKLREINLLELIDSLHGAEFTIEGNGSIRSNIGGNLTIRTLDDTITVNFDKRSFSNQNVDFKLDNMPFFIKKIVIKSSDNGLLIMINPLIGSEQIYLLNWKNLQIIIDEVMFATEEKKFYNEKVNQNDILEKALAKYPGLLVKQR